MKWKWVIMGFIVTTAMYFYLSFSMAVYDQLFPYAGDYKRHNAGGAIGYFLLCVFVFCIMFVLAGRAYWKGFEGSDLFNDEDKFNQDCPCGSEIKFKNCCGKYKKR